MSVSDFLLIIGLAACCAGLWWIYPPVALLFVGGVAIVGSWGLWQRQQKQKGV